MGVGRGALGCKLATLLDFAIGPPILCLVAVKRTIKIHVAGQQYQVRSDAEESYVQSLAENVNTRVSALLGNRQVATQSDMVLAALQLADELLHEKQQHRQLRGQVRERTQRLLDYVARLPQAVALAPPPQAEAK